MSDNKRGIAILGSTGSIGTQALEVIEAHSELFRVEVLSAHSNSTLLYEQAMKFKPNVVVIGDESKWKDLNEALFAEGIKVYAGASALEEVVSFEGVSHVLTAMVGFAGLLPTIAAIKAGKTIALANKETLVVAGALISDLAAEHRVSILPVDSEHSAIFQCLVGEMNNPIEKIILTASGGPFRTFTKEQLLKVDRSAALKHPNWTMGAKITIDSATLMNKGLEVIEAKWLFDLKPEQIDVIVHPESIIHSLVQFEDGSIKAQMGLPDMKLPIQYALGFPNRLKSGYRRYDFSEYGALHFEKPKTDLFPCLNLAYEALKKAGNTPCVLNAANEVAVDRFLKNNISFLDIAKIVEYCLNRVDYIAKPNLEDYMMSDKQARIIAAEWSTHN